MSILFDNPPPAIGCGDPGDPIDFGVLFTGSADLSCAVTAANTKQAVIDYNFKDCSSGGVASLHISTVLGNNGNYFYVGVNTAGNYAIFHGPGDAILFDLVSVGKLRGKAAHYHPHVRINTALAVASDRVQLWLGGRRMILTGTFPAQNADMTFLGGSQTHHVGSWFGTPGSPGGGGDVIISRPIYEDSVTPQLSDFGYFNAYGQWVLKTYNGPAVYHLPFGNGIDLGADETGVHDFTASGLTVDNQVTDTPSNNLATLDPNAAKGSAGTLSNGNLTYSVANNNVNDLIASTLQTDTRQNFSALASIAQPLTGVGFVLNDGRKCFYYAQSGTISVPWEADQTGLPTGTAQFEILVDHDLGQVRFKRNGSFVGVPVSIPSNGPVRFATRGQSDAAPAGVDWDFGQGAYVPSESGYKLLSSGNLTCPDILKPDDYFTVRLPNGGLDIIDLPWSPMAHKTLVVSKGLDTATSWRVSDTLRGNGLAWRCDVGGLEVASSLAFTANGVAVGADTEYQGSRVDYFWRASPKAGFDIVDVNHVTGTPTTVPHNVGGLVQYGWEVPLDGGDVLEFHHKLPAGKCLVLNSSAAVITVAGGPFTSTANTVTIPSDRASGRYILYLWRGVPQFSAFDVFDGTGNPEGPMLPLDFLAKFTVQKRGDQYGNYYVHSTEQNPANPVNKELLFDLPNGESTVPVREDILSNGIKIRMDNNANNVNGARITFAAWAQTPGKFACER